MNKNRNMRFSLILVISFLFYLLPEFLFRNTMLYLSGGIIGGTISEILKNVSDKSQTFITFLIWIIILIGFVFLFFRLNYKPVKYFLLILIVFFLYIIDNLVAIFPFGEPESFNNYALFSRLITGLLILVKSAILSLIIYKGFSKN